jgi:predicted ATPase
MVVTGEAGSGKTALIESATAGAAGVEVVWGTCREGSGVPGLWPWVEVLRDIEERGLLAALPGAAAIAGPLHLPESPSPDPDGRPALDRFAVFDAVSRLLRTLAASRALVVVLDDLQWADAGTIRLLSFLVPDLRRSRLLVLAAYRDDEVNTPGHSSGPLLAGLAGRATTIPLPGLNVDQVAELLGELGLPATDAEQLQRRTGGNPFFVHQISRLNPTETLPAGVRDTVRRRLDHLPRDCRGLLAAASTVGRDISPPLLAAATGRTKEEVVGCLVDALPARVVEDQAWVPVRPRPVPGGALRRSRSSRPGRPAPSGRRRD